MLKQAAFPDQKSDMGGHFSRYRWGVFTFHTFCPCQIGDRTGLTFHAGAHTKTPLQQIQPRFFRGSHIQTRGAPTPRVFCYFDLVNIATQIGTRKPLQLHLTLNASAVTLSSKSRRTAFLGRFSAYLAHRGWYKEILISRFPYVRAIPGPIRASGDRLTPTPREPRRHQGQSTRSRRRDPERGIVRRHADPCAQHDARDEAQP